MILAISFRSSFELTKQKVTQGIMEHALCG